MFVPKPHTPFQWEAQLSPVVAAERLEQLARALPKTVEYRFGKKERDDLTRSYLEGVLARGDRRLWSAIRRAWELGARFDGWGEHFRFDLWQRAMTETGIDPDAYALRARREDEVLPWSHLDMGTPEAYLRRERNLAGSEAQTPDCRTAGCHACGVSDQTACPEPPAQVLAENPAEIPAPPAPEREAVRLRLRYQKIGDLCFVGHLDLVNLFRRAARRARLPLHYSVGFHPQPSLSFGPPLSVGYAGLGEWLDLGLDSWRDPRQVVEELNRMLPPGVRVEAGREVPLSTPSLTDRINAGEYLIRWSTAGEHAAELEARVAAFAAASEVPGSQWSKKGPVKVNLRAAVVWIKMDSSGADIGVRWLHETGPGSTAKVSTLVEYFSAGWAQPWQAQVIRTLSGRRQGEGVTIP
ncbi:MAG: DUF2344 domain-containing protein [Candidatus Firestonebacteria bacterium]|nr:DUF2344 domain-containing protein [Candidatus Firestonebacteria bacterium]